MMNIYEKINAVKTELLKANLKKSWKNKFAWYEYFELSDFLPFIVWKCKDDVNASFPFAFPGVDVVTF